MRSSTSLGAPQPRRRYHTRNRHGDRTEDPEGDAACARGPSSTHLATWSEYNPGGWVSLGTPEPALASFLIDRPRYRGPPPPPPPSALFPPDSSGIARRLPGNCTGGGPQTSARTRGRSSPRDLATPTVLEPRDRLSHPPRSIQVCFHILALHPSAHLEGTRGLSFWREPHQVRETHKAMGRWEPNLG